MTSATPALPSLRASRGEPIGRRVMRPRGPILVEGTFG
jgi:hypothetical protein